jgi:hypothetical protein
MLSDMALEEAADVVRKTAPLSFLLKFPFVCPRCVLANVLSFYWRSERKAAFFGQVVLVTHDAFLKLLLTELLLAPPAAAAAEEGAREAGAAAPAVLSCEILNTATTAVEMDGFGGAGSGQLLWLNRIDHFCCRRGCDKTGIATSNQLLASPGGLIEPCRQVVVNCECIVSSCHVFK